MNTPAAQILAAASKRYGPIPESFVFGDGIDWSSPLTETRLYVELPFWLMTPPGTVNVESSGATFAVDICSAWMEVFIGQVTDSRASSIHNGPLQPGGWLPPEPIATELANLRAQWLQRPCKTVLRLTTRAHFSRSASLTRATPRELSWNMRHTGHRCAKLTCPSLMNSSRGTGCSPTTTSHTRSVRGTCPCGT